MWIVIPGSEASQLCVLIVNPTREGEGLEAGICVVDDIPELVVVDALGDGAIS